VDELRRELEALTGKKIRLNIQEVWEPELDAYLVARSIAQQIERRVAYRRAMKQTVARSMQRGAKGVKVICAGRLAGAEIARRERWHQGRVPLQTLRADVDFGIAEAHTTLGRIGVKVWVYRGDVLPEGKEAEEAAPAAPAAKEAPVAPSGERPAEKESIAADATAKAGEASQDA
jgi:small subunit ribosomal protein S3